MINVVLYNQNSLYGKVHILRNSPDPVAISIAEQELLEMLGLVPNVWDDEEDSLLNQTVSSGGGISLNSTAAPTVETA